MTFQLILRYLILSPNPWGAPVTQSFDRSPLLVKSSYNIATKLYQRVVGRRKGREEKRREEKRRKEKRREEKRREEKRSSEILEVHCKTVNSMVSKRIVKRSRKCAKAK